VVCPAGVVAVDPCLQLGVEVAESVEALAVEGGAVEFLEGDPLEAFADGVVVGSAARIGVTSLCRDAS
jgi:hypothetical protein